MGSAPRDDLQVQAPACKPSAQPSFGEQGQSCLDAFSSCPPLWPRHWMRTHVILAPPRPLLRLQHLEEAASRRLGVSDRPYTQLRVGASARLRHPLGWPLLPKGSGLPPGWLYGPAWHPHLPLANSHQRQGHERDDPLARIWRSEHEEQGCVLQRSGWHSEREHMPKATWWGDGKAICGLLPPSPVPSSLALPNRERATVHLA